MRLDNREEIGRDLRIAERDLRRLSDTALLFECLLKWREQAVEHLIGEFAFAFWDSAAQRLILARDIFGFRPLHYYRGNGCFAFASMPSGLHVLPEVPRSFDADFMAESLALLPHRGSRTYYRDIHRVEPAHIAEAKASSVSSTRYWRPPSDTIRHADPRDYEHELRTIFDQAVNAQIRGGERGLGTHLSSGLDSSIVTSSAAIQIVPERLTAFTAVPRRGVDYQVPAGLIADEGELAAATARLHPNIDHVLVEAANTSPFDGLDREHYYQQQPIANLCNAVWGREINRMAHERRLRVLLIGSTGNFSVSYSGMEWLGLEVAHGRFIRALRSARSLARNGVPWRTLGAQLVGPFLPKPLWTFLLRMHGRVTRLVDYSAINPRHLRDIELKARAANEDLTYAPQTDPLGARVAALSHGDGGNYFKGVLAEWGLSIRDPMADRRVVSYCLSIPAGEFLRGGAPRSLARRTFAGRLPKTVLECRRRGYQSADWYVMLGENLAQLEEEIEAISRCSQANDAIDISWLRNAAHSWPKDGWARDDGMMRYRYGLLRGISAGHFMRKVAGTN